MNRCLRSLSCFFTLAGLALFSTDATARASHKPHAQKAHEATKKSHAGKEARPQRSAALGKNRHAKHTSAQRKAKRPEASPAPKEAIAPLTGTYDFLVIDCPPRLSLVSFAALCASEFVLIPMEAADWGAQGILQVSAAIRYVRKHYNPGLKLLGYVVSRFKTARAYQRSYLTQLRSHFGSLAFDTVIPDLAQFEKSVIDRLPITLRAPSSPKTSVFPRPRGVAHHRPDGQTPSVTTRTVAARHPGIRHPWPWPFLGFGAFAGRGIQTSTSVPRPHVSRSRRSVTTARHNTSTHGFHCNSRYTRRRPARTT